MPAVTLIVNGISHQVDVADDINGGNAGAEDEAVLLSKAPGKPVRVQWMRHDDLMWSTQSPAAFSDLKLAWDAQGTVTAYQADHCRPAMQDDRLVGAVLAGLPTPPPPSGAPEGDPRPLTRGRSPRSQRRSSTRPACPRASCRSGRSPSRHC